MNERHSVRLRLPAAPAPLPRAGARAASSPRPRAARSLPPAKEGLHRKSLLVLAALLCAALIHAAPALAAMAGWEKDLYEKARKEGQFTWYTSQYFTELGTALCNAFEAKYPGIQCNLVRQTTSMTFQRYGQDRKAGIHVASVVGTTEIGQWQQMKKDGWLQPYFPHNRSGVLQTFIDHSDHQDGAYWITTVGVDVIAYNTKLVAPADVPRRWTDLLEPKWKNKIALGHPGFSGYVATWVVTMRELYGWDYFTKMEKLNPIIGRSVIDTATMLNVGEAQVALGHDGTTLAAADKGNPLAVVYPEDGAVLMVAPSGIPNDAPAPNCGKLMMEFLLSREASEVLVKYHVVSLRSDVKPLKGARPLDEIKTIRPPEEEIDKGIPEVIEQWHETFGV